MEKKRISVFLARCGIASRRACEAVVLEGRVKINGEVTKDLSTLVSAADIVELDGKPLNTPEEKISVALNKPPGYLCTARDDFKRKTVMELLAGLSQRLYPAGRLDFNSRGLLILTNDGELAYRITHPSFKIPKTYNVKIKGIINMKDFSVLSRGFEIEGKIFKPLELEIINKKENSPGSCIKIKIAEGRKRVIRKAFEALGHRVTDLKRVQIGNFKLGSLKEGQYKILQAKDLRELLS
ncbi:MAG: rRNA pseudouridine synthase [Actinobacteria bacterium]|nr:rRNA pseudouridine synthase [Actinomycetota bacterium]